MKKDSFASWLACNVIFHQIGRYDEKLEAKVYKWILNNEHRLNFNQDDLIHDTSNMIDWNRLHNRYRVVVIQFYFDDTTGGRVIDIARPRGGYRGHKKVEYWTDPLSHAKQHEEYAWGGGSIYHGKRHWSFCPSDGQWVYENNK